MLEGFTFVALFFMSQYLVKQKKVSMILKLKKYFYILCLLYTILLSLEIFVSTRSINEIVEQANSLWFDAFHYDKHKVITYFLAIRLGLHLLVMMSWVMYLVTISKFNNSMIAFHTFLNNYR